MDIVCIRGDGLHRGDDIIEPLLATVEAALARGRSELDNGTPFSEMNLTMANIDARLGQLIDIDDIMIGHYAGKVTGLSHTITIDADGNLNNETQLNLRVPRV